MESATKISANPRNSRTPGRGLPFVNVSMKRFIIKYRMPMPPMTTRLTITVQTVACFVFLTPGALRAYFR